MFLKLVRLLLHFSLANYSQDNERVSCYVSVRVKEIILDRSFVKNSSCFLAADISKLFFFALAKII
jgi:hypothetical protein